MVTKARKIALVIGAGGVQCAAALGALRVLQQEDIALDMIVGGSSGAFFAAAIAMGWEAQHATLVTRRFWARDLTGRRNNKALLQALAPARQAFDGRFGLRDDGPLRRGLQEAFDLQTFGATKIPLFITATDFYSGEQVVLQKGLLLDALRATMAQPFVFAPWPVNGRLLLDGALSDPLPGNVATREGADIIIALGFASPRQSLIDSPLRYALQIGAILTNSIFKARLAFHSQVHHADLVLLSPRLPQRSSLFDAQQVPALVAAGEEAMRQQLPALQALIAARPLPAQVPLGAGE